MALSKSFKKWLRKQKKPQKGGSKVRKRKTVQKGGKKKKILKNMALAKRSGIMPGTKLGTYLAQTK